MIFHRAFFREVLRTSGVVTGLITTIYLVIRVVEYLGLVAVGTISVDGILSLIILRLLSHLDVITPLGVYIALLIVLRRWSQDNELVVLFAAGLSFAIFLRPTFTLLLVFGIVIGGFSFYLSPLALRTGDDLEHHYRTNNELSGIVPGVFMENLEGDGVYFVEGYAPETSRYGNIFVWAKTGITESIIKAENAIRKIDHDTGDSVFVLENGTRIDGNAGNREYEMIEFESYGFRIKDRSIPQARMRLASIPTLELRNPPPYMVPEFLSEIHWRVSKVIALPVAMLLALAFGASNRRDNPLLPLLAALSIYVGYAFVAGYLSALARRDVAESLILLWGLHITLAGLGAYVFQMRCRNRPLLLFT